MPTASLLRGIPDCFIADVVDRNAEKGDGSSPPPRIPHPATPTFARNPSNTPRQEVRMRCLSGHKLTANVTMLAYGCATRVSSGQRSVHNSGANVHFLRERIRPLFDVSLSPARKYCNSLELCKQNRPNWAVAAVLPIPRHGTG